MQFAQHIHPALDVDLARLSLGARLPEWRRRCPLMVCATRHDVAGRIDISDSQGARRRKAGSVRPPARTHRDTGAYGMPSSGYPPLLHGELFAPAVLKEQVTPTIARLKHT
jgi:hypothetical protein